MRVSLRHPWTYVCDERPFTESVGPAERVGPSPHSDVLMEHGLPGVWQSRDGGPQVVAHVLRTPGGLWVRTRMVAEDGSWCIDLDETLVNRGVVTRFPHGSGRTALDFCDELIDGVFDYLLDL